MFDIVAKFPDKAWLDATAEKLNKKLQYAVKKSQENDFIPYAAGKDGNFQRTNIRMWTNGFWPAMMWQMYLATKDETYRAEAIRTEEMMDEALADFKTLHHDVGFMWLIHCAVRYKLEGNQESYDRVIRQSVDEGYPFYIPLAVGEDGYTAGYEFWDWYGSELQQSEWGKKFPEHLYFGVSGPADKGGKKRQELDKLTVEACKKLAEAFITGQQ